MNVFAFAPLIRTLPYWPKELFGDPGGLLDEIGLTDFTVLTDDTELKFKGTVAWLREIEFKLPALDAVSIALLSADGFTQIPFELQLAPQFELRLIDLHASIRIRSEFLRPVKQEGTKWVPLLDSQGKPKPAEITLGGVDAVVSAEGEIEFVFPTGAPDLSMTPLDIGGSGIVLEISKVGLYFSGKQPPPPGAQPGFKGIAVDQVTLHLSGGIAGAGVPDKVTFEHLLIGSSGFSGKIEADWTANYDSGIGKFTGSGAGTLFGIPFGINSLALSFQQNVPTGSSLKGAIKLPFFDQELKVEIGFTADGGLTVGIDSAAGDGLGRLSIPSVLDLELDSLKFEVYAGVLTATISGKLIPKVPGLNWPTINLKDLKIDSKGNVKLPGGWLDLPSQCGLDFHGFKVAITKFGMGRNEDGTKWIGFSGSVKLVDGLPAGASVEGLRITADEHWTPSSAKISFNGVGVELDAKAFYFKGAIAYREFLQKGVTVRRFDGDIKLKLRSLKLEIDGSLVVGSVEANSATNTPAYNFFAIYIGVDLPTGIPFGTTGIAFYGFGGLLAIEMEPDKKPDWPWYAIDPADSWYKKPTIGVADLKKWVNAHGSKAFGASVTLGTYADNGYIFNGKVLLAIVFPGPIILLEGMANLLKARDQLTTGDPLFRALAVLDNRPEAGSLLIGLDVKYKYDKDDGKLIKISAGTEAYYKFSDPTAWHIYLGIKEPREQRIQADILSLFSANAYLMLDARKLAMGAWVGYDKSWNFGPLSVTLQAWMENNAVVSFKPAHLYADLWVHGAVDLKAFGFGLGLTIDARLAADVFDPFQVLGDFEVEFHLPWPFKKKHLGAHVQLKWGPRPGQPPIPAPLKDVAIEHFKTSTKWPLPMPTLLKPNYADADGFLLDPLPDPPNDSEPPFDAPVVPLDCRPSLGFSRNVNDDAQVGTIVQPLNPESEQIGDPTRGEGPGRVKYGLKEVRLEKWNGSIWKTVAGKGGNSGSLPELFGTWAPINGTSVDGVGQNKLLLWSKTGFDHLRHTGSEWGDWFTGKYPDFPCLPASPDSRTCFDFEDFDSQTHYPSPLTHPNHAGIRFEAPQFPGEVNDFTVTTFDTPIAGKSKGLRQHFATSTFTIIFDQPVNNLRIIAGLIGRDVPFNVNVSDKNGMQFGPFWSVDNVADIGVSDVTRAVLLLPDVGIYYLLEVCTGFGPALLESIKQHNEVTTAAVWRGVGDVLEPYTSYRLRIVTTADFTSTAQNVASKSYLLPQLAYFQTAGPPGLSTLTKPAEPPYPDDLVDPSHETKLKGGLDDLTLYVQQTIPPTVPKTGELPLLPRPVYRGYDVGILFNEDYVDLMYRLAGRDLSLLLYDRNNQPVRDRSGRLVVLQNPWGVNEQVSFNAQETPWISLINNCGCLPPIDPLATPHDQTLTAADEQQILDPDMLYDARLMPLLVHEDFSRIPAGTLGRWQVSDRVTSGGPSHWQIEEFVPKSYRVTQTSGIGVSGTWPGTMLVLGNHPSLPATDSSQPPIWSDYRVSLFLRSQDGTIGAAFRYVDKNNFYLFTMDRPNGAYRLLRVADDKVLAENQITYDPNRDYHLVIEAIGDSLRIYLDETLLFDVTDSTIANGGLALQCSGANGAAFSDIQVHDFSKAAKCVYHFPFTTSEFVDFFHHLHSFDDECWRANCTLTDAELTTLDARATSNQNSAISDDEARAFERLAENALGTSANQLAARTEFTRIERAGGGDAAAFLFRSPEPIDWSRSSLACAFADQTVPSPLAPGSVKLVAATLGSQQPANENITLLVREATDLTGYRIEKRDVPVVAGLQPPPAAMDDPAAVWSSVYEFGSEKVIAPGTQVVVNSGNPDNPPAAVPRVLRRFRAPAGAPGDVQFAANEVDLRLVDAHGEVVHARRFLNGATSYNPVNNFHLLRKADGTAFFLLPAGPPGAGFLPGTYQMRLDFRRDNTVIDPDSLVLSAAGQTVPETAILDVPSSIVQLASTVL
jgi:hypothetical protein